MLCISAVPGLSRAELIPQGSKIYITPMEGTLDSYITAEIIKQQLPAVVVVEPKEAQYILMGSMTSKEGSWHQTAKDVLLILNGISSMRDKNQSSVLLVNPKTKSVIWAVNVGDRRFFLQLFQRTGAPKLAKKIVKRMKKQVF